MIFGPASHLAGFRPFSHVLKAITASLYYDHVQPPVTSISRFTSDRMVLYCMSFEHRRIIGIKREKRREKMSSLVWDTANAYRPSHAWGSFMVCVTYGMGKRGHEHGTRCHRWMSGKEKRV
jgi:hypothetical protein